MFLRIFIYLCIPFSWGLIEPFTDPQGEISFKELTKQFISLSNLVKNLTSEVSALKKKQVTCCHPGYSVHGSGQGFYLKYFSSRKTWQEASRTCLEEGASLVEIDSKEKNTYLKNAYGTLGAFWLGGNDLSAEGRWVWTDGTSIQGFSDWLPNEPDGGTNQNCMILHTGGWENGGCSDESLPFLCEMESK